MQETELQSRAEKVINPFIKALDKHPRFSGLVHRANHDGTAVVPSIVVSASGGEEREETALDSWGFDIQIVVIRGLDEVHLLDEDAATIELVTSTQMEGDPNIELLIAEDGSSTSWETDGKTRLYQVTQPVLVGFS